MEGGFFPLGAAYALKIVSPTEDPGTEAYPSQGGSNVAGDTILPYAPAPPTAMGFEALIKMVLPYVIQV